MNVSSFPTAECGLASEAAASLRFRYRTFVMTMLLLAGCVALSLAMHGSAWSKWALSATGWIVGAGVPWLGWHLRVPFAARVAGPLLQLGSLSLGGIDPRSSLWTLADLPVLFFLAGWVIDVCLRQRKKGWALLGRILFSLLWCYFFRHTFDGISVDASGWLDMMGIVCGIVIVWLPREMLTPRRFRSTVASLGIIERGLQSAGGWLATRAGIAALVIIPAVIFLDLLDLPPLLRQSISSDVAAGSQGTPMLLWKRECRALTEEDFQKLEIRATEPGQTRAVIEAIGTLRLDPRNAAAVTNLVALGPQSILSLSDFVKHRSELAVFYIDRKASGDDRVTAGMWSVPDPKLVSWNEIQRLTPEDVERTDTAVRQGTVIILTGGVLILLLLGGPSGGVPAAWWIAIFIAGTNIGWVHEPLKLLIDRVQFTIWRDYSNLQVGAILFGLHSLVEFLLHTAHWLSSNLVSQAGIWVSLCWPARRSRLVRSWLDRLWLHAGKVTAVAAGLWVLRFGFFYFGQTWTFMNYAWFAVFPVLLVLGGAWWRRRLFLRRERLPVVGKLAAAAFLLRASVPLVFNVAAHLVGSGAAAVWLGHAAVGLAVISVVMLVIALEHGTFLSPPHVEGQIWIIAVAAIPILESLIGNPFEEIAQRSGLFLGTTVGWLAFAAGMWVINPVYSFIGDFLSRWRAKGMRQIADFHDSLKSFALSNQDGSESISEVCDLFDTLEIEAPRLWKHLGKGVFQLRSPAGESPDSVQLISACLADGLAETSGALRLEEMRLEWRWAAFHGELDQWFSRHGDLLVLPAHHQGVLVGLFCASDVPENRFLLRPAVSTELGKSLATALLITPASATTLDGSSRPI